jgi:Domain of unknown function (DUF6484)
MNELELDEARAETADAKTFRPQRVQDNGVPLGPERTISGVRIGVLVGLRDDARIPLVMFPGQRASAAVPARATLDLHGAHIGRDVVLMFEDGEPTRPIVLGCCLPQTTGWPLQEPPGQVEVDADGERLIVTAKEQLVLRCGKASVTLTKAGKVLIQGTYVSSRSSGVNRVKGGSVELN